MSITVSHGTEELNQVHHRRGCPQKPERTEIVHARGPVTGTPVIIARCLDCGRQVELTEDGEPFETEDTSAIERGTTNAKANG